METIKGLDKIPIKDLNCMVNKMLKGKRLNVNGVNFYAIKKVHFSNFSTTSSNVRLVVFSFDDEVEIAGLFINLEQVEIEVDENYVTIWEVNWK